MTMLATVRRILWMIAVLVRSGMLALLRPDRYVAMGLVIRRQGITAMTGIGLSAARAPHATGLIDELGSLTWRQLDQHCDALAAAIEERYPQPKRSIAILCRNHRGFVTALAATGRLGADALLLNTAFSAPQLADVLRREGADLLIYDDEFADLIADVRDSFSCDELVAWTDAPTEAATLDELITSHVGRRAARPTRTGRVVLLTSGTTGTPKGARRSASGGIGPLAAMLDRIPWHAGETTVVAAPMFHAWGFGQLAIAATMTCTIVTRRRFDPVATMQLVDEHAASGLAVVPVMLERIVDLPPEVLAEISGASLRFVTASGSRMRPDSVLAFMDRFGDVVFNSYNATEVGLIATATPADLRVAADTAGRSLRNTEIRIVDDEWNDVAVGEIGQIVVLSDTHFEGYTSGDTKTVRDAYMASGDLGRVDDAGLLYVVGRNDDMIVSGGENVYPIEVEQVLLDHSAVREVAVIGVPDANFGQRLAAFVALHPGAIADAEQLRAHVKAQLAAYKVPRDVTLLVDLPRNASGKVVTRELTTRVPVG